MSGRKKSAAVSSKDAAALDAKPLRTLTPMFPAPMGLHTYTPPNAPSFVCVTPFGPAGTGTDPALPAGMPPMFMPPGDPNQRPPFAFYMNGAPPVDGSFTNAVFSPGFQTPTAVVTPASGKRRGRPPKNQAGSSGAETESFVKKKVKRPRPEKVDTDLLLLTSTASDDPRESVQAVLMMFDALRRRLVQMDEVEAAKELRHRHDLKAGSIMMTNDLRVNKIKRIGQVPGVEVGDIFYFRIEMCLVGLNNQSIAGIDYTVAKFGDDEEPVAVSIVSAGVYENAEDDVDVLIYSGQGLSGKDDQKLERGNLALEKSLHRGNEIRVVRSVRDFNNPTGKIYIYDGLYKIKESWVEKGKSGFNVFKYKFVREPDQPDGIAVWKMTEKWREDPSSRGNVISSDISLGVENTPVCLLNDIDDEKEPPHFTYSSKLTYKSPLSSTKHLQGCNCTSVCLPGDYSCSCAHQNGDVLPYSGAGILVSRKPLLFECSDSCRCSDNCRNRVTQKGTQLHFEVFKTRDRGWGLRSWDPIRAGTFICEYAGEVINNVSTDIDGEQDDYVFQTRHSEQTFKWNYAPELLGEPSLADSSETSKQLPIIISAKRSGNISRFMNHSCSPNVFWQPVLYDHGDEGYPHIAFFAIRHIPPMTELTYDYGLSQAQVGNGQSGSSIGSKSCLCGSPKCRRFFG